MDFLQTTLCYLEKDGCYLMLHRVKKKNDANHDKWVGVGGKFEPGETALQCVLREVREELHIDIEDAREMGVLNFSFACGTIPEIRCHVFMATSFTGTPMETPEAEPFWCPVDGIPYDLMWQDDRFWLPAMLDGKRFEAFFTFEGDRMLEFSLKAED